jgi:hypothetical protein
MAKLHLEMNQRLKKEEESRHHEQPKFNTNRCLPLVAQSASAWPWWCRTPALLLPAGKTTCWCLLVRLCQGKDRQTMDHRGSRPVQGATGEAVRGHQPVTDCRGRPAAPTC